MRPLGQRRVSDAFVGNTEASELLGVLPSNTRKTLSRYGVEGQIVLQGKREVHIYHRDEVERVARELDKSRRSKRAKATSDGPVQSS